MDRAKLRRVAGTLTPTAAALLVYAATIGSGFLYDDDALIRTNRWVQDPGVLMQLPSKPLLASPPAGTTNYYRPVVNVLYNLTWQAGGGKPFAFHLLNVALHMLNATLLLLMMCRTGTRNAAAVGAASLFAAHPLTSEVVAWPSCLPELGYTAFGLSALLLHMESWKAKDGAARVRRGAACGLFFLACACKETALAFVPLVALIELWLSPEPPADRARRWRSAARGVAPYVIAAGIFLAARTAVLGGLIPRGGQTGRTLADAVLNAPWLLLMYAKAILVPWPLLIQHVISLVRSVTDIRFVAGIAAVGLAIVAIVRAGRRRPVLAFAASLIVASLLPAAYIPALGRDPFAERYAYLAVGGFCWLLVQGAEALDVSGRLTLPRWLIPSSLFACALAAGIATADRCADWKNDDTLGRASMRDAPHAPVGYMLSGSWHLRAGEKAEALRIFNDGVTQIPGNAELRQYAIGVGTQVGDLSPDEAVAAFEELAPQASGNAAVQFNLGQALLAKGRLDEAKLAFHRTLALSPSSVDAMTALAVIASKEGDLAGAVAYCRRALAVDDRSTMALQQLGVTLLRQGDFAGAVSALERAVQLDAADKESLNRLGVAYVRTGRRDEARKAWERALAIDPEFEGARQNLTRLHAMAQ